MIANEGVNSEREKANLLCLIKWVGVVVDELIVFALD